LRCATAFTLPFSARAFAWNVTYEPPTLSSPLQYKVPGNIPLVNWPAYNGACAGQIYLIEIPADRDAVVTMGTSTSLDKPIWIVGGRNVRVVGLDISLKPQSGCNGAILAAPGGMALRIEQAATSFVEGLKLDLNGHYVDCIVARNYKLTAAQGLAQRNIYIQNSACRGGRGTYPGHPAGDIIHADFFQNQGLSAEPINRVVFENITQKTSASGVVLDGTINESVVLNYQFGPDERYTTLVHYLNPLWMIGSRSVVFRNIYTAFDGSTSTGAMPTSVRNETQGVYYSYAANGVIQYSSEVKHGRPAVDFAPWDLIGLKYVSPHPAGGSTLPAPTPHPAGESTLLAPTRLRTVP
jgi:hypothetical protein